MTMPPAITTVVEDGMVVGTACAAPIPWWSFGKTVLAAAALALVAAGRLELDTPVGRRPFTLRQLLQHRAGLAEYGRLVGYHRAVAAAEPPWPPAEVLRRVGEDHLSFAPGEGWGYSNVGYMLVARLIEAAADDGLATALDRLVLGPLGITGVVLAQVPADLDGTAWGNAAGYHPGWVYHGLLVGAAASAALLLHRLLRGDLLPPALLAEMTAPHPVGGPVPERAWRTAGYGLGLMIGEGDPPGRYVGHTGGGPGSTAAVYQPVADGPGVPVPRRTAAAFAPLEHPGPVEGLAMRLASGGTAMMG